MDSDEEMIVVVVDNANTENNEEISSPQTGLNVEDLMKIAEEHGQVINVKKEEDYECEYLEDTEDPKKDIADSKNLEIEIKEEIDDDDDDPTYIPNDIDSPKVLPIVPPVFRYQHKRISRPHPISLSSRGNLEPNKKDTNSTKDKKKKSSYKHIMVKNFVEELRQKYPELKDNKDLMVDTLEQIMRTMKPPQPPRDYYIMNGIMFECIYCGSISDSIPAASRHYQEKHGPRYLICFACGVDFRSTTNLFKHEKRCVSPDAILVLRARALYVGPKGRGRPSFSGQRKSRAYNSKVPRFACKECSAVFMSRSNLVSHENLHKGERPYLCPSCPAAYTSSSALSRHLKTHSDAKYTCDICSRWFRLKAALVTHMDTHNAVAKFGCDECDRRFCQKAALVRHVDRVHKNLPPPCACQMCPKRYPRMYLLKAHMKREHGMTIITRKMFFKALPTMSENEIKNSKVVVKVDAGVDSQSNYVEQAHNMTEFLQKGKSRDFICVKNTSSDIVVQKCDGS